jgi:hypothetical protein
MTARWTAPEGGATIALLILAASSFARDPPGRPITPEERRHRAFVRPVRTEAPAVKDRRWVRDPIDAYLLGRLEDVG